MKAVRCRYGKTAFICITVFLSSFLSSCSDYPFVFAPNEWNFGSIYSKDTISKTITIQNTGKSAAVFAIISTCNCLSAVPDRFDLSAGERLGVSLAYDPSGNTGEVEARFILMIDREVVDGFSYSVYGTVVPDAEGSEDDSERDTASEGKEQAVYLSYYFESDCAACKRPFVQNILDLEIELGVTIFLEERNILEQPVREEYLSVLNKQNLKEGPLPAVIVGDVVLQGKNEIDEKLKKQLTRLIDK